MEELIRKLLSELGEDTGREGLQKTPGRVARSLRFLTEGYRMDPKKVINGAQFTEKYNEMILVKDIAIYSLCEQSALQKNFP